MMVQIDLKKPPSDVVITARSKNIKHIVYLEPQHFEALRKNRFLIDVSVPIIINYNNVKCVLMHAHNQFCKTILWTLQPIETQ